MKKLKQIICFLFGHDELEELGKPLCRGYAQWSKRSCKRCGKVTKPGGFVFYDE